jgi:serine/threonine-protein kinase
VAICSAVAVIALLIFLVVILNGGLSGDVSTVPVPTLVGQNYKELDTSRYPSFEIVLSDYNYSDEYEHGIIMDQTPKAGDQVVPGTQIKIWVSMGPKETELPVIEDLKNMTEEAARNYLDALQGKLVPIVRTEHSDDVEEGKVIRTEPAAGEPLTRGQTVTIYISAGPELVKKNVPNVIGANITGALAILNQNGFEKLSSMEEDSLEPKGQVLRMEDPEGNQILPNTQVDVKTEITVFYSSGEMYAQMPVFSAETTGQEAMKLLTELGFKNVTVEEEYHEEIPAGNVIRTNIPSGTKVDVTAAVVLVLSSGPEPTEPPTESIAPPLMTKEIVIYLPQNMEEPYTLTIMLGSGVTVMDGKEIQPGTETITVVMTGTGVMYYEIYINGEYLRSEKVDFSA